VKQLEQRMLAQSGISILRNDEEANADDSIAFNDDGNSNEMDSSN
jgi:hypothetical protein